MEDKTNQSKRSLTNIITDGCVAVMLGGSVLGNMRFMHNYFSSEQAKEYLGTVGSVVVDYGIVGLLGIGGAIFTYDVVKAYDKYQLERRK